MLFQHIFSIFLVLTSRFRDISWHFFLGPFNTFLDFVKGICTWHVWADRIKTSLLRNQPLHSILLWRLLRVLLWILRRVGSIWVWFFDAAQLRRLHRLPRSELFCQLLDHSHGRGVCTLRILFGLRLLLAKSLGFFRHLFLHQLISLKNPLDCCKTFDLFRIISDIHEDLLPIFLDLVIDEALIRVIIYNVVIKLHILELEQLFDISGLVLFNQSPFGRGQHFVRCLLILGRSRVLPWGLWLIIFGWLGSNRNVQAIGLLFAHNSKLRGFRLTNFLSHWNIRLVIFHELIVVVHKWVAIFN